MANVRFVGQQILGEFPGLGIQPDGQIVAALEKKILDGDISQQTDGTIRKQLSDPKITERALDDPARAPNPGVIAGLILGSPEFQRR